MQIESILRGEPRPPQQKCYADREKRILTVFSNRDDYSLVEFLRGIAHNISL
jgi:hypothetical protein